MKQKNQFSVCMCVYRGDDPQWFDDAAGSILEQTAVPDQIVLVVDGPVPEALEAVIRKYEARPVFTVVWMPENKGLGIARKVGLEHCRHELVAMMDADDLSVPERFALQLAEFEKDPKLSIVGGQISEFIDSPENKVGFRQVPLTHEDIREYLKTRCPFNHMTVMVRLPDIMRVGGYMDWYYNEDYYLWIRMYLADLKFANVPQTLVNVRVGEDMYQRRGGRKYFASELGIQKLMRKHKIIGFATFHVNVAKRLVVQVLLPNKVRGWVFKKFARSQENDG
jgi:glycosyltransferase involved in cell wall biosynthesis